mgnify:CR=1 FL=1
MASELTVTILRFVFFVVAAARRDLGLGKNFRSVPVESAADSQPQPQHIAAPPARPSRLVITKGVQAGAMMQLGDSPVTIGRANDIEVSLQDDYASGRHARLFPQGSRWFLEDLGSTLLLLSRVSISVWAERLCS